MQYTRYKAEDLINFAVNVLTSKKIGFPYEQARAAAEVLVEADLRGDPAHGLAGGSSLDDILVKVSDGRINVAEYSIDSQKYPAILTVNANGTLGHFVAMDILPKVIEIAKKLGMAKAYIRNSTHFGDCGIYSERVAKEGLVSRVTSTSPQWTKPFIELQEGIENSEMNRKRYSGVQKRFGTNPIAWSIPYNGGIITIDMATTQRAVSPALDAAKHNKTELGITFEKGIHYIGIREKQRELTSELHLRLASMQQKQLMQELHNLGYENISMQAVEGGLLKGPIGEDINYPLVFDTTFKDDFWVAPLGGTYFGYKGFGLNMLIELDNVIGGGVTGRIRELNSYGKPATLERVSQTIEAYAMDVLPTGDVMNKLKESVETTIRCGNNHLLLPGEKEQLCRQKHLTDGIPYPPGKVDDLRKIGEETGVPFNLKPIPDI